MKFLMLLSLLVLVGCASPNTGEVQSKSADITGFRSEYIIRVYLTDTGYKKFQVGKDLWTNINVGDGFDSETFTTFSLKTNPPLPAAEAATLTINN